MPLIGSPEDEHVGSGQATGFQEQQKDWDCCLANSVARCSL